MNFKRVLILFVIACLLVFGWWLPSISASAAPTLQVQFSTATPGADGRILYTVQENDTCIKIALLHGISVEQLRALNAKLDADCTLSIGQTLLVGVANLPSGATAGPSPTSALPTLTPTPFTGTTEVCVLLYDDMNGDALRQTSEPPIDGGAVGVTNLNGSYSKTQNTTSALDPNTGDIQRACFSDVPPGDYNISVAIPDAYNATMSLSAKITVEAGDRASIDFGAQSKAVTVSEPVQPQQSSGGTSPLLGIFGALLLLGGVGLGWYAFRLRQPQSRLKGSPLSKK